MPRYQVVTHTRLKGSGQVGAALFVASPIIDLFLYRYVLANLSTGTVFMLGVAGSVFLASIVMMIEGREQYSTAVSSD